jgi:hypothetical protein
VPDISPKIAFKLTFPPESDDLFSGGGLRKPSREKAGNSLVFYQGGGGGGWYPTPPHWALELKEAILKKI